MPCTCSTLFLHKYDSPTDTSFISADHAMLLSRSVHTIAFEKSGPISAPLANETASVISSATENVQSIEELTFGRYNGQFPMAWSSPIRQRGQARLVHKTQNRQRSVQLGSSSLRPSFTIALFPTCPISFVQMFKPPIPRLSDRGGTANALNYTASPVMF